MLFLDLEDLEEEKTDKNRENAENGITLSKMAKKIQRRGVKIENSAPAAPSGAKIDKKIRCLLH